MKGYACSISRYRRKWWRGTFWRLATGLDWSVSGKIGTRLEVARFLERCCLEGVLLHDRPVTPEAVLDVVENSRSQLARACFMTTRCLQNLHLHGKPVTTDMVLAQYPDNQADLEQAAYFKKTVLSQ